MFMQENCRSSCQICSVRKADTCGRPSTRIADKKAKKTSQPFHHLAS